MAESSCDNEATDDEMRQALKHYRTLKRVIEEGGEILIMDENGGVYSYVLR